VTFTNDQLDTTDLPRFEDVIFKPLHPDYKKVLMINSLIFILVLIIIIAIGYAFIEDFGTEGWIGATFLAGVLFTFIIFSFIALRKKGYAFREHDVIFRSGIISTHTAIIPYNRVQHVAVHEGALPRLFNLAEVQIFTAGGGTSDIGIPGIKKEEAENIKQLLMGKIQKQLS